MPLASTTARLRSAIAEEQAADTFFPKDTGITLLQQVAQLKARLDVYDAHANVPFPAVNQHTFIPASVVPKPTPFDGCPEICEHFVVSISNFLGLTLSPPTPTSDAFLQVFNRNYAGYDLELEARHAYPDMRQSEVQDTMPYIQQWRQGIRAQPRNFEEFDRVEACRQSLRPAGLRSLATYQGNIHNFAELIGAVKRVQIQREEERRAEQQRRPVHTSSSAARQDQRDLRGSWASSHGSSSAVQPRGNLGGNIGNSSRPRMDNVKRPEVQPPSRGNSTGSADGPSSTSTDVDHATTDMPSDNDQHGPEYATVERLLQQLYLHGNITASSQTYLRGSDVKSLTLPRADANTAPRLGTPSSSAPPSTRMNTRPRTNFALLEASWKFANHYDQFLL
ncbi:hypothetical protein RI367_005300 [Sorochytrium milnesiophthora]